MGRRLSRIALFLIPVLFAGCGILVMLLLPTVMGCPSIEAAAWYDTNSNGVWEDNEDALPDVSMSFFSDSDANIAHSQSRTNWKGLAQSIGWFEPTLFCRNSVRPDVPDGYVLTTEGERIARRDRGVEFGFAAAPGMPTPTPRPVPVCDTHIVDELGSVRQLEEDVAGNLWAAGDRIARFDRATDTWEVYGTEAGLPDSVVRNLVATPSGDVWITFWAGNAGAGAARYRNGAWRLFTTEDGLPTDNINDVDEAMDGTIWITMDDGIARRGAATSRWQMFISGKEIPDFRPIWIDRSDDGSIWFSGYSTMLMTPPVEGNEPTWQVFNEWDIRVPGTTSFHKLTFAGDQGIWLPYGVYYDRSTETFAAGSPTESQAQWYTPLSVDSQGGLWSSRYGYGHYLGVYYAPDPWRTSPELWRILDEEDGLASNEVHDILVESKDVVWFATADGLSRCLVGGGFVAQ